MSQLGVDTAPSSRPKDGDDFWEWFDAPIEVPDRPRRRAERAVRPQASGRRRAAFGAAWIAVAATFAAIGLLVLPALVGMKVLSVYTGSMAPAIKTGDAVLVRPVHAADLREGDVAVYRPADNPSALVTHRTQSIRYETGSSGGYGDFVITTKGDNNSSADKPFRASPRDDFGRVTVTLPKMGYVLNFLSGGRGKALAVLAFVVFVVAGSISRRRAREVAEAAEAA